MPLVMKYDDVPLWHKARLTPAYLLRYRFWRSAHRRAIFAHRTEAGDRTAESDERHLEAALRWLLSSQDAANDGGFTGRYRLDKGWSTSYPETTGYIIPTLLALAEASDAKLVSLPVASSELIERATRAGQFLLDIQFETGAFPAGEIGPTTKQPSPFNTAQIINGLHQFHKHSGVEDYFHAATRACDWLVDVQDEDGAWRQWFYHSIPATYCAHLACWLAEFGVYAGNEKHKQSAFKNAEWILSHQDKESGFFDKCGFTEEEQRLRIADLHTVAYNQAGLIRIGRALESNEILAAVTLAADGVLETFNRLGWLPGVLDFRWLAKANSACLTGCAQMALVWMDLFEIHGAHKYLDGAERALELVKKGQILESEEQNLAGAIPGSDPLWGWYNDGIMPNWAAKFFIDAVLQKQRLSEALNQA